MSLRFLYLELSHMNMYWILWNKAHRYLWILTRLRKLIGNTIYVLSKHLYGNIFLCEITIKMVSILTGLDLTKQEENMLLFACSNTTEYKPSTRRPAKHYNLHPRATDKKVLQLSVWVLVRKFQLLIGKNIPASFTWQRGFLALAMAVRLGWVW